MLYLILLPYWKLLLLAFYKLMMSCMVDRHCCLTIYGLFVIGGILAGEVKKRNLVQLLTSEFLENDFLMIHQSKDYNSVTKTV